MFGGAEEAGTSRKAVWGRRAGERQRLQPWVLNTRPRSVDLKATGSNWRSVRGREKMRSEWQKDECAQDIKLIKAKS